MNVSAARSERARAKASGRRPLPPELVPAEGLLHLLGEMAVSVIENARDHLVSNSILDTNGGDRATGPGMDVELTTWEQVVISAWNAYASGLFGQRDIHVAVNAAMGPLGYSVALQQARRALVDDETAKQVVQPHIYNRCVELRQLRQEHCNMKLGDRRGAGGGRPRKVAPGQAL